LGGRMVEKEFKNIRGVLDYAAALEREPETEEALSRDFELSEQKNYEVMATVKSKGAVRFKAPDLSQPMAFVNIEVGAATAEGFGRGKITFKQSFDDVPGFGYSVFGFYELEVPWVAINWRVFRIGWWRIRIPIPRITKMTVRLPVMCFLMNVKEDGFEVLNVIGRSTIAYTAIGR